MNTSVRTGEGLDLCWGVGSFFFKKQNQTVVQLTSLEMNVQGKFWQSRVTYTLIKRQNSPVMPEIQASFHPQLSLLPMLANPRVFTTVTLPVPGRRARTVSVF